MWGRIIIHVGYYINKFIKNKMKMSYNFVFFNLIVMIFFLEGRPDSGVVCKINSPLKKRRLSAHAAGF